MKTTATKIAAAILLAATACAAHASGAGDPVDMFVNRLSPDVGASRYEAGELGVVLPSFPRIYLYPAWRAIVLGRDGMVRHPVTPGGLARAVGPESQGWAIGEGSMAAWTKAVEPYMQRPPATGPARSPMRGDVQSYLNCTDGAFAFALENLRALEKRPDAHPARLRDWVTAQDVVFDFCDADSATNPPTWRKPKPRPAMPQPLPESEPLYWRQLRDYQIATAHFYDEAWDESAERFDAIAKTAGHPLRSWGGYLALRSEVRKTRAFKGGEEAGANLMARLTARAAPILADAQQASLHEATRALLRIAAFRLTPQTRFETLSTYLADVRVDPYRSSALGDWRLLATQRIEQAGAGAQATEGALRAKFQFVDWMRTLQRCAYGGGLKDASGACPAERRHARDAWLALKGDEMAGEKRAWLVAVLTVADSLAPDVEEAAWRVDAAAPEYVTVRYHLARLYRLAGKPARAREIAQAMLDSPLFATLRSDGAAVLFRQERFAAAASRDDAAGFLQRTLRWQIDTDTLEIVERKNPETTIASDGKRWLNRRLAIQDLLVLANDAHLAPSVRAPIAVAAWMRADLLGRTQMAAQAASLALEHPGLRDAAAAYLVAPASDKRHVLLVSALKLGLSPQVGLWFASPSTGRFEGFAKPPAPIPEQEDQPTASMWCRIGEPAANDPDMLDWEAGAERVPPPSDLSADRAVRDREIQALGRVKTATGFIGDHALAWAKSHPNDPDLPWLLHVVVMSTRGGCVEADNRLLSRAAYQLLHSRYAASPWALRTPYWY